MSSENQKNNKNNWIKKITIWAIFLVLISFVIGATTFFFQVQSQVLDRMDNLEEKLTAQITKLNDHYQISLDRINEDIADLKTDMTKIKTEIEGINTSIGRLWDFVAPNYDLYNP